MRKILFFVLFVLLFFPNATYAAKRVCVAIHKDYNNERAPILLSKRLMFFDAVGCKEGIVLKDKHKYDIYSFYEDSPIFQKLYKKIKSKGLKKDGTGHDKWTLYGFKNILGDDQNYFKFKDLNDLAELKERKRKALELEKKLEQEKIAKLKQKKIIEKKERVKAELLRKKYVNDCKPRYGGLVGYKKDTPEFEECINEKIKLAEAEQAELLKLRGENIKKDEKPDYTKVSGMSSIKEIQELEQKQKISAIKKQRDRFHPECEQKYGGLVGYKKGTVEYEKCINDKIAEAQKAELTKLREEKQKKIAAKKEEEKIAKMSADDRRDYTCQEKFGFRKGSQQFNDCRFKLFTAEMELQKIQMQKELAEAKAEAAKARADAERVRAEAASTSQARQEALLSAQTEAAKMQAAAAMAQAQASNMQSSLQMINQGLNMMSGPTTPSVNLRTTCTYTGTFLNCF